MLNLNSQLTRKTVMIQLLTFSLTKVFLDKNVIEMEENIFKIPPKRKRAAQTNRKTKKSEPLTALSVTDTESESSFSDCSVTCSVVEWVYQYYLHRGGY